MPYATQAQMIDRFGEAELIQLTDRAGAVGALVMTVLDAALADADQEIDSYLRPVRALPLPAPIPQRLVRVAADVARYHLYDSAAPDDVRTRYDDAVRWLRDVATGRASLGAVDTPAPDTGRMVVSAPASALDWASH